MTTNSPEQSPLISLTYVSTVSAGLEARDLLKLLVDVRPKNESVGVTGMLLYSDGNVIQVLEGPAAAVDEVFGAIEVDARHHGLIVIIREEITTRSFPEWSMGFRHLRGASLDETPGLTDFLRSKEVEPNAGSARRLLELFRDTMR